MIQKERNIVLLPTDKASRLYIETMEELILLDNIPIEYKKDCPFQHLYITSDEYIKEGDWFIHSQPSALYHNAPIEYTGISQCEEVKDNGDIKIVDGGVYTKIATLHKIIATTDTSLIDGVRWGKEFPLPQIPESFIKLFVEEYNKGNEIIDKVLVEYEVEECGWDDGQILYDIDNPTIKLNLDNTINISVPEEDNWFDNLPDSVIHIEKLSVKEVIDRYGDTLTVGGWKQLFNKMYSREKVEKLLKEIYIEGGKSGRNPMRDFDLDEWIKGNLK